MFCNYSPRLSSFEGNMMHEVIDKKFNPLEVVDAKISNSLKRFAPAETCYDQRRNTQGPINCMVY